MKKNVMITIVVATSFALTAFAQTFSPDINNNGTVDIQDLGILLSNWNQTGTNQADLNNNGAVDIQDLGILLSAWGMSRASSSVFNEPTGFSALTKHQFISSEEESGWFQEGSFGSLHNDPTTPGSAPNVLRAVYSTDFEAGSAPGNLDYIIPGNPTTLYGRFWVKFSNNWYGHLSGTNKMTYIWINDGPHFFLSAEGAGTERHELYGRMQGTTDTPDDRYLPSNVGDGTLTRGEWHLIEYLISSNSAANSDGTLRIWLDGALTHDYTDLRFNDNGGKDWQYVEIFPIWGGTGGSVPQEQYMYFDDYYVSAP